VARPLFFWLVLPEIAEIDALELLKLNPDYETFIGESKPPRF